MEQPDELEVYTVIFLTYQDRFLLLQRSPTKRFAPGRWTGLGGHVEPDEYGRLRDSALREVQEESGFIAAQIVDFCLRRTLFVHWPGLSMRVLLYYTGRLEQLSTPDCPEGKLEWVHPSQFDSLDIIETTRMVLDKLVEDVEIDMAAIGRPCHGLAVFDSAGHFQKIVWDTVGRFLRSTENVF